MGTLGRHWKATLISALIIGAALGLVIHVGSRSRATPAARAEEAPPGGTAPGSPPNGHLVCALPHVVPHVLPAA
jgi:hypothetical protein